MRREALVRVAADLLREAPAFTRRNLLHALLRSHPRSSKESLERSLTRHLARAPLPGLLPARCRWSAKALGHREGPGELPDAVVLVDRRPVLDLFVGCGATATGRLGVVCLDGYPPAAVTRLKDAFGRGAARPVVYVHDAASVVYPFAIEPLATLLTGPGSSPPRSGEAGDVPLRSLYADLGLPPLGARARRFGDPRLEDDELVFELEALPPATLIRYCTDAVGRLTRPADPRRAR